MALRLSAVLGRRTSPNTIISSQKILYLKCQGLAAAASSGSGNRMVICNSLQVNGVTVEEDTPILKVMGDLKAEDLKRGTDDIPFYSPTQGQLDDASFWLRFAWPWRKVAKDTVLDITLEGEIPEKRGSRFSPTISISELCDALQKAAVDPRIRAVCVTVKPLSIGWGKVLEIRRNLQHFRKSGKMILSYLEIASEKEYVVASACGTVYATPQAYISLRGSRTGGQYLRGTLEKIGVEPQIQRIGKYKSAGDQLLRKDMSDAEREVRQGIVDDVYEAIVNMICDDRGLDRDAVIDILDRGLSKASDLVDANLITETKYAVDIENDLRTMIAKDSIPFWIKGDSEKSKKAQELFVEKYALRSIKAKKYAAKAKAKALPGLSQTAPTLFNSFSKVNYVDESDSAGDDSSDDKKSKKPMKRGLPRVAIIRATGAISGRAASPSPFSMSEGISSETLIKEIRRVKADPRVVAVVLRVDSPGGDALASDIMWKELRELREKKPVIASMGDVAASGGYYISMAASKIVAEPLTLTGSIGVITGKFNLAEFFDKVGIGKTYISRGRYAEVDVDNRAFTEEEQKYFEKNALIAYESFRNKAALSRNMDTETMQMLAQGRVWTGRQALAVGLVDEVGGIWSAINLAKRSAKLTDDQAVNVVEISRTKMSPLASALNSAILPSAGLFESENLPQYSLGFEESPSQTLIAIARSLIADPWYKNL